MEFQRAYEILAQRGYKTARHGHYEPTEEELKAVKCTDQATKLLGRMVTGMTDAARAFLGHRKGGLTP